MYLGYQENNGVEFIASVANTHEELENNEFMKFTKIEETQDEYKLANGVYIIVAEAFEKAKIAKRAEINKARDEAEQGGFEYLGKIFDSDQVSAQRISMAAQAIAFAPEGTTITWTCQDNSTIDLSAKELVGLVIALAEWSNTCHKKATELKSRIDEAKSEEELNKIVWDELNDLQIEENAVIIEEVLSEDEAEPVEESEVIEDGLQREEKEVVY